jgi:hypothetical protein
MYALSANRLRREHGGVLGKIVRLGERAERFSHSEKTPRFRHKSGLNTSNFKETFILSLTLFAGFNAVLLWGFVVYPLCPPLIGP